MRRIEQLSREARRGGAPVSARDADLSFLDALEAQERALIKSPPTQQEPEVAIPRRSEAKAASVGANKGGWSKGFLSKKQPTAAVIKETPSTAPVSSIASEPAPLGPASKQERVPFTEKVIERTSGSSAPLMPIKQTGRQLLNKRRS